MGVSREWAAAGRMPWAVACAIAAALPFLVVQFPPLTDLPQHVAQIRLFLEAVSNPESGYRVQWLTPYSTAYGILGLAWAVAGPADAGRLALAALAVLWVAAVHGLAAARNRPLAASILASVLFFNHTIYWGFLSFAVGWLAFAVWLLVVLHTPPQRCTRVDAARHLGAALLLYFSHVLWFVVGVAWLIVYCLMHRAPARVAARRVASVVPVVVLASLWYPRLAELGFVSPTLWFTPPPWRLDPTWLVDAMLGGLYGAAEYAVAGLCALWVIAGLWQQRAVWRQAIDADLLSAGILLCLLALLLPDQHMNTIQFAARWLPAGATLLILAAPRPVSLARQQLGLALAVIIVFSLSTALAWKRFERDELSGLSPALAALPDGARVLGLDLVRESPIIKGRPFLQTFAYAQVLHGGTLNTSFAGFAPSPVIFKRRRTAPWTHSLEWFAERVTPSDFSYFDYALINGAAEIHAQTARLPLVAVTDTGRWRLYRVIHDER